MKTSEFIKRVGLRYKVISADYGHTIKVVDAFYDEAAVISCLRSSDIFLLTKDIGLAKLCIEYAETPIHEREEEKKYIVVLPDPEDGSNVKIVLARTQDKRIVLNVAKTEKTREWIRFHLTESEIKRNHEYLWQFAKEVEERI